MKHVPSPEERKMENIRKSLKRMYKNMETLYFAIEGTPIDNPGENGEKEFLSKVKAVLGDIEPIKGPIRIECFFYFKRPKSHYGTGINLGKLKNNAPSFHIQEPYINNLETFLFDTLKGYLWKDNSQINVSTSIKAYLQINDIEKTIVNIYY